MCSGKVYFDLAERRDKTGRRDTAIVRIEQFYPLTRRCLTEIIARYPKGGSDLVPGRAANAGGFHYMDDVLRISWALQSSPTSAARPPRHARDRLQAHPQAPAGSGDIHRDRAACGGRKGQVGQGKGGRRARRALSQTTLPS
jgi:2-oxoglutarate dehydrogenase complex dehydrogenase (E1) component-like enzyme